MEGARVCRTIRLRPAMETVRHRRGRERRVRLTLSRARDSSLVPRQAETRPSAEKTLGIVPRAQISSSNVRRKPGGQTAFLSVALCGRSLGDHLGMQREQPKWFPWRRLPEPRNKGLGSVRHPEKQPARLWEVWLVLTKTTMERHCPPHPLKRGHRECGCRNWFGWRSGRAPEHGQGWHSGAKEAHTGMVPGSP